MSRVACSRCGDIVEGATHAEAREDAVRIGWEQRSAGFVCDNCVLEEEEL